MKKITSKKLSKRLMQYGALSVAALAAADATGQIVYTDVDPDEVLNVADVFSIDMNGDAVENLNISNPDGLAGGNAALAFPSSGGAFVGFTSGGFEYPNLLAEGDSVSDFETYTANGVRGDLNYYGCAYSNSQWCDEVVDGYLGVRFTLGGDTHYGWVRMDTDVGGSNLIVVKGFAYNATPGEGITAGDEGELSVGDQNFNNFNYFVNQNSQLILKANTSLENLQLFNLLGQEVISQKLSSNNETINLSSLDNGIYIAQVTIEGNSKSFKIVKK